MSASTAYKLYGCKSQQERVNKSWLRHLVDYRPASEMEPVLNLWPCDPADPVTECAVKYEIISTTVCYYWMLSAKSLCTKYKKISSIIVNLLSTEK